MCLCVYTVPVSGWPLGGCCHSNGTTVMPLLQSQCLFNVPIAWYSSGLFHVAVDCWGPGPSRKCSLGCVWSLGGMKSKGNTHQDSCIVQCPTFLCFLCGNPPGFQLFQSLAPSKWVLYTYRLPPCNNNMVQQQYDIRFLVYLFTKICCYILHLIIYTWSSVMCKNQEISPRVIHRYYNKWP